MSQSDEDLETYVIGDQPVTCGKCGARTEFSDDHDTQHHHCLNPICGYEFLVVAD